MTTQSTDNYAGKKIYQLKTDLGMWIWQNCEICGKNLEIEMINNHISYIDYTLPTKPVIFISWNICENCINATLQQVKRSARKEVLQSIAEHCTIMAWLESGYEIANIVDPIESKRLDEKWLDQFIYRLLVVNERLMMPIERANSRTKKNYRRRKHSSLYNYIKRTSSC